NREVIATVQALASVMEQATDREHLDGQALALVAQAVRQWQPVVRTDPGSFELVSAPGSRHSGLSAPVSPALVHRLLATALDPVLDEACTQPDPEAALLQVKICDPVCGAGTFLRAAAQRMGRRLAALRAGQQTPLPVMMRQALYDISRHCLYGVDID